jgi:hypothetical protein
LNRDKQVFRTVREAKDHLAGRVAEEAQRDGIPLTEVERKMLYFSEADWTLPDIKEVSAEFDRDNDQNEYRRRISELAGRIRARQTTQGEEEQKT